MHDNEHCLLVLQKEPEPGHYVSVHFESEVEVLPVCVLVFALDIRRKTAGTDNRNNFWTPVLVLQDSAAAVDSEAVHKHSTLHVVLGCDSDDNNNKNNIIECII